MSEQRFNKGLSQTPSDQTHSEDIRKGQSLFKEILMGDLHEGEASWIGTAGQVGVGFIPIVGQIADARDTYAAIKEVTSNPAELAAWGGVGIAIVCWIPGMDWVKGFKKGAKKALMNDNWKTFLKFSNKSKLLRKGISKKSRVKYGIKNLISDHRTHNAIRKQYKNIDPQGLEKIDLHHLWVMNKTKVPKWLEGFKNSGLNYLELPNGFNRWMGGKFQREFTFRMIIASLLLGSFAGGAKLGWMIGNKLSNLPSISEQEPQYKKGINLPK